MSRGQPDACFSCRTDAPCQRRAIARDPRRQIGSRSRALPGRGGRGRQSSAASRGTECRSASADQAEEAPVPPVLSDNHERALRDSAGLGPREQAGNKHLRQAVATCGKPAVPKSARFRATETCGNVWKGPGPTLHAGGHRFDPGWLHYRKRLEDQAFLWAPEIPL